MNLFVLCALFCFSSSVGMQVFFKRHPPPTTNSTPDIFCGRHEFIYNRGDYFNVVIKLVGNYTAAGVTKSHAIVRQEAGTQMFRQLFWGTGRQSTVEFYLEYDSITIDIELTQRGMCQRVRVLEGTEMSTLPEGSNVATYSSENSGICLRGTICYLDVDAAGRCLDRKLRPRPCFDERDLVAHARTAKDLYNSETQTAERNITASFSLTDYSKEGVEFQCNTYFTMMIVTSVTSAVALILLLVIAIRQRNIQKMKSNPPDTPLILSTNDNRYYENVVFRPESCAAVEQRERVYDVPSAEN